MLGKEEAKLCWEYFYVCKRVLQQICIFANVFLLYVFFANIFLQYIYLQKYVYFANIYIFGIWLELVQLGAEECEISVLEGSGKSLCCCCCCSTLRVTETCVEKRLSNSCVEQAGRGGGESRGILKLLAAARWLAACVSQRSMQAALLPPLCPSRKEFPLLLLLLLLLDPLLLSELLAACLGHIK